jgi:outer membrane protein TolC
MTITKVGAIFTAWTCFLAQVNAQESPVAVERPTGPVFVRPYLTATVPPIQLGNSDRVHQLLRGGKLYLTLQDAIALAIENNLDLEVDRYGPLLAEWTLERMHAGGPLKGVTSGNSVVNQLTSGLGVLGSEYSAGLVGNSGGGGGGGNAVISQIGPITQNLDPVLQSATAFSHTTAPQTDAAISQTVSLISTSYVFNSFVQQGLLTGGYVQIASNNQYLKQNAPTDTINPAEAGIAQVYFRHNLLNSFGTAVNSRFIRVAEKNVTGSHETFRSQLLNQVANVLNLYWDLVADREFLKVRQRAVDAAQKFYDDTNSQIKLGVLAKVEIFRAQAELSTRKRELSISQADVRQQENLLKNALIRDDTRDPVLDEAEVVPLDQIQIPEKDELPPMRQLLARALAKRPDIVLDRISGENAEISALGTANGLLPSLQVIAAANASGLSGTAAPYPGEAPPNPYFVGGVGNVFAQIARRDFPGERGALLFQGTVHNRQAQGDYGVDQLQLRQNDLVSRRSLDQLVVDISNQIVALRQARARYATAADSRILQQQLLDNEQQSFALGGSKINDLIAAEEALVAAQAAEITALSTYSHARVALDQVLGETLEKNRVSSEDALQVNSARH